MNPGIIDRLIDRLDKLEPEEIQSLVLRAVQEKGFLERVFDVLREGTRRANAVTERTLAMAKEACGLGFFQRSLDLE